MASNPFQLKLSRVLPAPCEVIFDMWLNPESLRRWMRPGDSDVIYAELNPVVGGTFRIDMRKNDGQLYVHEGQYLEIRRPAKIVFTWNSTVLGDRSSRVTVEFFKQAENCLMVLLHDLPPDDALVEDHRQGWTTILDLLVKQQKSDEA
jgi:uncharacterized protein YndB with AHSA1/START domain